MPAAPAQEALSLELIIRTCTRTNVMTGGWKRFVPFDKKEIVLGCVHSVFRSIHASQLGTNVRVLILDDGSDAESLELMVEDARRFQVALAIEQLGGVGFNRSALEQFARCRDSKAKWVYSVEDDYLHAGEAIKCLLKDIEHFKLMLGGAPVAIHPFDDPFTYHHLDKMANSKVVLGCDRHWRTNTLSTNTLLTAPEVFSRHWPVFEKLAREYGVNDTTEHNTINLLWNNGVDRSGPVFLFTPIPSLALHLSYNNEPAFIDWRKWWNEASGRSVSAAFAK